MNEKMKWTRKCPGVYISGQWRVEGEKTSWCLLREGALVQEGSSKKSLQRLAEELPDDDSVFQQQEEPEPPPTTKKKQVSLDDLHGVMTSLYLDMTGLSVAVTRLSTVIEQLNSSVNRLTKKTGGTQ